MNLEKIFKNTILLYLLSEIIAITLSHTLEKNILGQFLYNLDQESDFSLISSFDESMIILVFALLLVIAMIFNLISLFFLYTFKPFGKKLFMISFIFIMFIILLVGGGISSGPMYILDSIGFLLEGIIICFLFFTPIKEKFN
jgi:multisubunit Na+/H+ antiporter MnhB subunit